MASSSPQPFADWPRVIRSLIAHQDLERTDAEQVLASILQGEATDAQISAFVVGLAGKGESTDEVLGLRDAMLAASTPLSLPPDTVDIVGVGGAAQRQIAAFNVSTIAAMVASAAGATVCKHGNRKASSTSGSFDLLEALGVNIEIGPERVEACVRDVGVGYAYARAHHPAMRHAGPTRTQLGVPTIFNVLGPIAHPGRVRRQVLGVPDAKRAQQVADVVAGTEPDLVWVVHGSGDLDELTTVGPTQVIEIRGRAARRFEVDAADHGLAAASADEIVGGDAATNARIAREIMNGEPSANRDMIVLNAAAALVVAEVVDDISVGVETAAAAVDDGRAAAKLEALIAHTNT